MLLLDETMPMPFEGAPDAVIDCRALEVSRLRLEVGGKRLLDDIDLSIGQSGITAVMGANGAGKSLFLRTIHGLIEPTAGTICWGGRPLSPAVRQDQAMVFQKPVLLRRSVAANLDFVLKGRREQRDDWLARVALSELAGQPARKLSGGEQQRLALARALATEPKVLLLDEPTASLDPISAAIVEALLIEAAAAGVKIVLVTHNPTQARRLADDVLFLHAGQVVWQSTAPQFFECTQLPEIKAYMSGVARL